ncbi:DNA polymerase III subunit gamma/tau [Agromyces badenianii]|uniref:DNA polymerase III subunit gamma/tau n=2 Tax=Agromyces badenianii TaxID=2080742 RepID=A0A2S0WWV6_9MICO|nr:DNA polymerase III subunit gamma/tau [Agromyces badenianii]
MVSMTRDPDDDALRWEGDDDPTLAPGWKAVGTPASIDHPDAGSPGDRDREPADRDDAAGSAADPSGAVDASPQTGSAELVALGVLGGVYLLYAIGWLITALAPSPVLADPVAQFMYTLGAWCAVLAAPLWFGAVLWLGSDHRRARLIWLIAGAVLLVPVPFLLRG